MKRNEAISPAKRNWRFHYSALPTQLCWSHFHGGSSPRSRWPFFEELTAFAPYKSVQCSHSAIPEGLTPKISAASREELSDFLVRGQAQTLIDICAKGLGVRPPKNRFTGDT
jgi:hypothetical protein